MTKPTLTDLLARDEVLAGLCTKESLLAHGVRLFHRYGAAGTSVDKVLAAAGKSKSQFYSHFSNKDDFICSVLELEMTTMLRVGSRYKVLTVNDVAKWFLPYIDLASLPENLGCPVGPLASELGPSNERVRKMATVQFERWQDYIVEMFTRLAAKERFPAEFDARNIGCNLAYSIQGAFLFCRVFQSSHPIEAVRDNILEQLRQWQQRAL